MLRLYMLELKYYQKNINMGINIQRTEIIFKYYRKCYERRFAIPYKQNNKICYVK